VVVTQPASGGLQGVRFFVIQETTRIRELIPAGRAVPCAMQGNPWQQAYRTPAGDEQASLVRTRSTASVCWCCAGAEFTDARQQFSRVKGFEQVVVCAGTKRLCHILLLGFGGQHDDGG